MKNSVCLFEVSPQSWRDGDAASRVLPVLSKSKVSCSRTEHGGVGFESPTFPSGGIRKVEARIMKVSKVANYVIEVISMQMVQIKSLTFCIKRLLR